MNIHNLVYSLSALAIGASHHADAFSAAGTAIRTVACTNRTAHIVLNYLFAQHAAAQNAAPAVPNNPKMNESVNIEIKATMARNANMPANVIINAELAKSRTLRKVCNAFVFMF